MKLYLFAASSESSRMAGSINSAIAAGSNESAAREAVVNAKPSGEFDEARFAAWSAIQIADGTITLPDSASVQFLGAAFGNGLNRLPGA